MPRLWATQRISKEVWTLPYLLSGIRIPGQASWSCKIELVACNEPLATGHWHLVTGWLLLDEKSNRIIRLI
jgi:hypothetical protein